MCQEMAWRFKSSHPHKELNSLPQMGSSERCSSRSCADAASRNIEFCVHRTVAEPQPPPACREAAPRNRSKARTSNRHRLQAQTSGRDSYSCQLLRQKASNMAPAEAVLEPCVGGTWVNQISESELPQMSKPLKHLGIDDLR